MVRLLLVVILMPLVAVYILVVLLVADMSKTSGQLALVLPLSYFLGAIPWGFLLTWASRGIDITRYGSGKIGMSNVFRTSGWRLAMLVLFLDLSKGLLAVLLARAVSDSRAAEVTAGLLALVGHNWPIFLGFKGGRGIATGLGGLLIISPIAGAAAIGAFIPVTLATRYLSLGSLMAVGGGFFTLLTLVLVNGASSVYLWFGGLAAAIIVWQHRDNIHRLVKGQERRLGQRGERIAEPQER